MDDHRTMLNSVPAREWRAREARAVDLARRSLRNAAGAAIDAPIMAGR